MDAINSIVHYGTGDETIRVLKTLPRWHPSQRNDKKLRVLYSLPITISSAE
jgi:protein TonB